MKIHENSLKATLKKLSLDNVSRSHYHHKKELIQKTLAVIDELESQRHAMLREYKAYIKPQLQEYKKAVYYLKKKYFNEEKS